MSTQDQATQNPRVFISYSWDSEDHRLWVESLATHLRTVGVDARLDVWRDENQSIDDFMIVELERADYVVAICTPEFKQKVISNAEGTQNSASGFEIGTAAAFRRVSGKPIIPVLARGDYADAAPSNLLGFRYYDFTQGDPQATFSQLKDRLLGHEAALPDLGPISAPKEPRLLPDIFNPEVSGSAAKPKNDTSSDNAKPPPSRSDESNGGGNEKGLRRRSQLLWIGPLLAAVAGVAYYVTVSNSVNDNVIHDPMPPITGSHAPTPEYSFVPDALILDNCEGSAGTMTGRVFGLEDEACVLLDGAIVWGCDGKGYDCARSGRDEVLNKQDMTGTRLTLQQGENQLVTYEEDKKGICRKRYPATGDGECVEMGRMVFVVDSGQISLKSGNFKVNSGVGNEPQRGDIKPKPGTKYETVFDKAHDGKYRMIWSIETVE